MRIVGSFYRTKLVSACIEDSVPMTGDQLDELIAKLRRLPSESGVYHKILGELRDPNGTLEQVGLLVGSDPAITVEVIKTVNSAAFGYSRTICDPIDAVMLLGGDQVLAIVLMVEVFGIQEGVKCLGFSFSRLLSHCRTVAWNSRGLMRQQSKDRRLIGAAFTGGLLHDVGKLLLAANFPDDYGKCTDEGKEEHVFGASHAAIGARFLHRWQMPPAVVDTVGNHSRLSQSDDPELSLSDIVYVANAQAHYKQKTAPSGLSLSEQVLQLQERFGKECLATWGFK